ncbi:hypothetical protein [Haloferax sp. DFSO60]|uniref:DUF5789 family protein n=1 Tax=Haloferax sp. DFSO60 TaxID=3388652 RepID=UPI003978BF54
MTNDSDDTREQGIEFGTLIGDLEDESYPLSHETLLSRYGDRELGLFDTQVPLREVLSPEQELEYEDVESVRQAVFNMVGDEAVGREKYSDRGGNATDDDDLTESESF